LDHPDVYAVELDDMIGGGGNAVYFNIDQAEQSQEGIYMTVPGGAKIARVEYLFYKNS